MNQIRKPPEHQQPDADGDIGSSIIARSGRRRRDSLFPGSAVEVIVDSSIAGANLYGGTNTLRPDATIPLHWHVTSEVQYVLKGRGLLLRDQGEPLPVYEGDCVFSPAGRRASHGFYNDGEDDLVILFFYPSDAGLRPQLRIMSDTQGAH